MRVDHSQNFIQLSIDTLKQLDCFQLDALAELIASVRESRGRLFVLGVGGNAANASHAVNDFRKLCGIEAYAPTDNVAELTARTNDDGWASSFVEWLRVSRLSQSDAVLVLSVGGGNEAKAVSNNIVMALRLAREVGAKVGGLVGRDGGFTAEVADVPVVIPTVDPDLLTPLAESFQALLLHLLVSHPVLQIRTAKWEATA